MSSGIQLVSLKCPACSSPLRQVKEGVFLYCNECGSGFEIDDRHELIPIRVDFARTGKEVKLYYPFWVFDARLELKNRDAKTSVFSNPKGLSRIFEERGAIRFYVPAYLQDLESKDSRALQLTFEQPQLDFIRKQSQVTGVVIHQNDARKIADYLFVTSEVEQSDTLRNLEYRLVLENPGVIVIGF